MARTSKDLCYLTIHEAANLLDQRQVSPVELTQAFLDRIDEVDGDLRSFVTLASDQALEEARRAETDILNGQYRGPLHGIPLALKDLYATKGIRTTAHSKVLADWVPAEDATTTAKLREAGAVLLGKLAMSEFALGGPDPTSLFPPARNPWNLAHVPGGSSAGSGAAVAAGLCMGALGSDTGGSIRGPAAFCGIVGLKPTYGRVSRHGVVPLSWTLDHCGPMTRTVEDAAIILQAIAGPDPNDPTASSLPVSDYRGSLKEDLTGLVLGVPRHFFFATGSDIDAEVVLAVEKALEVLTSLGAEVREVSIPNLASARAASSVIMLSEAFAYHERNLKTRLQDFGDMVRDRFLIGGLFTAADYVQAQRLRSLLLQEFKFVLEEVDALISPTFPITAPAFEGYDSVGGGRGFRFTGPYNLTGLPALSVPCGFTSADLPVGMQVAGRPFDETTVLRIGYAYQQATRWFERRPPL